LVILINLLFWKKEEPIAPSQKRHKQVAFRFGYCYGKELPRMIMGIVQVIDNWKLQGRMVPVTMDHKNVNNPCF
jgi:hypothetical protein